MRLQRATLATCADCSGLAVVIDVLRAFTTAGYLFEAGVREIVLTGEVQAAFALRSAIPGSWICGEVDGIQVEGFDMGNSPTCLPREGLRGRTVIQRTTAGTQGVVRAVHASPILTAAMTNANATVRYIRSLDPAPETVSLIQTGLFPEEGWGDEDVACADVLEALLTGKPVDYRQVAIRVRNSRSGRHYDGTRPSFPPSDLDYALQFDRFPFAMLVTKRDGLHVLRTVPV